MDSNLTMLTAVAALFSPMVISLITRKTWDARAKVAVMVAWSALVGVSTAYLSGNFEGQDILGSVLTAILVTATSYETIFKPTKISPAIEQATSPKPMHEADVTG